MDTLAQMPDVQDALAAPLHHVDFVIEPLDKTTCLLTEKVIGDFFQPWLSGSYERINACSCTDSDCVSPRFDGVFGVTFPQRGRKNGGEFLTGIRRDVQLRRMGKESYEASTLLVRQRRFLLLQRPHDALKLLGGFRREEALQTLHGLLASRLQTTTRDFCNRQAIHDDSSVFPPRPLGRHAYILPILSEHPVWMVGRSLWGIRRRNAWTVPF